MTNWLKQSTAVTINLGPFVDATDGGTPETALSLPQAEVRLSKNGGAFAQKNESTTATHGEEGQYLCPLNTTDTNTLGTLRVCVYIAGARPVSVDFMVVPANVWDSMFGSASLLVQLADNVSHGGTGADMTMDTSALGALVLTSLSNSGIMGGTPNNTFKNTIATAVLAAMESTTVAEGYAADGAAATPAQLLHMIYSAVSQFVVSGTALTTKKIDGTTTAMTFTLDSATAPTSRTRTG